MNSRTSRRITPLLVPLVLLALSCPALVRAHGICTDPRQRGALRHDNHGLHAVDWAAPTDYEAHYPAGAKTGVAGAGTESVKRAAHNVWTPYDPFDPGFRWRAGVCGDELGAPQDHLLGGAFYYDGYRVRTYMQGSVVYFESRIITHHNGYLEFFICNLDTCATDDISPRCFHDGHCTRLLRVVDACDSGTNPRCAPVDRNHPGRWYLPCDTSAHDQDPMVCGGHDRTMAYLLPPHLVCDHCVVQWYWTSANTCNPPGVREFFTSRYAPQWGDCPGQGGAIGGWPRDKPDCGGDLFSEEYWQCADVRIMAQPHSNEPPPRPPSTPPPPPPQRPPVQHEPPAEHHAPLEQPQHGQGQPPQPPPPNGPPHHPPQRPQGHRPPNSHNQASGGTTFTSATGAAPPAPENGGSESDAGGDGGGGDDEGLADASGGSSASTSSDVSSGGSSFSVSAVGGLGSGASSGGGGENDDAQPQRRGSPFAQKGRFVPFRRRPSRR